MNGNNYVIFSSTKQIATVGYLRRLVETIAAKTNDTHPIDFELKLALDQPGGKKP